MFHRIGDSAIRYRKLPEPRTTPALLSLLFAPSRYGVALCTMKLPWPVGAPTGKKVHCSGGGIRNKTLNWSGASGSRLSAISIITSVPSSGSGNPGVRAALTLR